jgi:CubicO group peptidase (beta-lactamase class C family)/beta-glucosidase-like glycosyl hydrolase
MLKKVFLSFFLLLATIDLVKAQSDKNRWVDSVFNSLSSEQKLGQLFMVTIPSNPSTSDIGRTLEQIKSHGIGGIIFQKGSPLAQATATQRFQETSEVPLFVGQRPAWGFGQSIDSTLSFPSPMVLSAIRDDSMIYRLGTELASQMKMIGVNLNFGPILNPGNNSQNALLNVDSFGGNHQRIARKTSALVKGLSDSGVLSCAGNFTVKGLTIVDVQDDFPTLLASIDSIQAYPFLQLSENNLAGIMASPSSFPLFYEDLKMVKKNEYDAETLSLLFAGNWLKERMGFGGLSFVDLEQLKDLSERNRSGDEELLAFQAGNDILIGSQDIGPAIRRIKKALKADLQLETQLDNTVRKILSSKYETRRSRPLNTNLDNLVARLNSPETKLLNRKLYEQAITIVKNSKQVLPVVSIENKRIAYITTDASIPNKEFNTYLNKYVNSVYYTVNDDTNLMELSAQLKDQDFIIVGVFPQTTALTLARLRPLLTNLAATREIIYCDFGNESFLKTVDDLSTVITAYTYTSETLRAIPQVIFGALGANGTLPFSISAQLVEGSGQESLPISRLSYSSPEDVRMNSKTLRKIDSIAHEAIRMGATPGCQVLVARNGKVVYEKSFGSFTYDKKIPVTEETIYDLASLTKVSATLQTVMFMYDRGLIDINKKVSYYLPELKKTNKKDITILEMLTHQAGLAPFIPMWPETMKDTVYLPLYYNKVRDSQYPLQVSPKLFAAPAIRDSVWSWIGKSNLLGKPPRTPFAYRYSDLGFLILQRLAEKILNQPLDEFVAQNFYEPLGAYTTGFKPLERFPIRVIAPTEVDKLYRKTTVVGTVHDERAAMMGGVAGHAGLFSNASDLAKLGQMLLQEGQYGGIRYYQPETVRLFTDKQFDISRRGLGWDKPIQSVWNSPTSLKASPRTFGHTGFTGTCIWVDPTFDLVYVFLSNRVYPDRNNKLITTNIRSRIQDVLYESIFAYCGGNSGPKSETRDSVLTSRR